MKYYNKVINLNKCTINLFMYDINVCRLTYYYVYLPYFYHLNLKMYLVCKMNLVYSKIQSISIRIALETIRDYI